MYPTEGNKTLNIIARTVDAENNGITTPKYKKRLKTGGKRTT